MSRTITMGRDLKKCRIERKQLQKENANLKQQIENMSSFSRGRISTLINEENNTLKPDRYYTAEGVLEDINKWERLGRERRAAKEGKTQGGKRKTRKRRTRAGRKRRKKTKKKRHIITRKNKRKRRRRTKKRRKGGMPKYSGKPINNRVAELRNKSVLRKPSKALKLKKVRFARSPSVRSSLNIMSNRSSPATKMFESTSLDTQMANLDLGSDSQQQTKQETQQQPSESKQ